MQIEWLNKKDREEMVIFFNGWGMDKNAVIHLSGAYDLLMVYDYRTLKVKNFPDLGKYRKIFLVAWSMGVWAAANTLPDLPFHPSKKIALNGTEYPIDDQWGIPCRIYQLTEKGLDDKGRQKFMQRMLVGSQEVQRFEENYPQRPLVEVCEELTDIRKQSRGLRNKLNWDKVYISEKDIIFSVENQLNWWRGKCTDLCTLAGGHYPFYHFRNWEEIIKGQDRL